MKYQTILDIYEVRITHEGWVTQLLKDFNPDEIHPIVIG